MALFWHHPSPARSELCVGKRLRGAGGWGMGGENEKARERERELVNEEGKWDMGVGVSDHGVQRIWGGSAF